MLPVLTSPLGSRKAILVLSLLSFTLYEVRASAKEPALAGAKPLIGAVVSVATCATWGTPTLAGGPIVLTRSAHDLGAAFTMGSSAASLALALSSASSPVARAVMLTALVR